MFRCLFFFLLLEVCGLEFVAGCVCVLEGEEIVEEPRSTGGGEEQGIGGVNRRFLLPGYCRCVEMWSSFLGLEVYRYIGLT